MCLVAGYRKQLTDDVWSLRVVSKLILVFVFTVLVKWALVTCFQNVLQGLQFVKVVAQAVDPQCLFVALDGPAEVGFAWGKESERDGGVSGKKTWASSTFREAVVSVLPIRSRSSFFFSKTRGVRPSGMRSYTCDKVFSWWSSSSLAPTGKQEFMIS